MAIDIKNLLTLMVQKDISDIHFKADSAPALVNILASAPANSSILTTYAWPLAAAFPPGRVGTRKPIG